jgi:hypothetical protein
LSLSTPAASCGVRTGGKPFNAEFNSICVSFLFIVALTGDSATTFWQKYEKNIISSRPHNTHAFWTKTASSYSDLGTDKKLQNSL